MADVHPVVGYCRGVQDGTIPACTFVKLAVERHLRDLDEGPARGLHFDRQAADFALRFFGFLRYTKAEWRGRPFELGPWQQFIIWNLFGWKRADGTRRFRLAYIEIPRKNGKSEFAAGIGLLLLCADGEPGAEVYAAATKKDQAKIVWGQAVQMVQLSPELAGLVNHWKASNTLSIEKWGSWFQPLGADSDTMDGLNVHAALIDELHAHKDASVVDVLETATGARRQPLQFEITTAGYDRESICWKHHEYTRQVLEGTIQDDTWFGFIATIDGERTEALRFEDALGYLEETCTCQNERDNSVLNIRTDQFWREVCAQAVMIVGSDRRTRNINVSNTRLAQTGRAEIEIEPTRQPDDIESDTSSGSRMSGENAIMASRAMNFSSYARNRIIAAESAARGRQILSLIMTMLQEKFEGYYADNAIRHSVFSEILKRAYNAHSSTCAVRKAEIRDDSLYVKIPADDWKDPASWRKANPNYGISVKPDDLERKAEKAKHMPVAQNAFQRLHLNIWTQQSDRWIEPELWDQNAGDAITKEALLGRECYGGLDLATVSDLAAWVLVFPRADDAEALDILARFWCPEARLLDDSNQYREQYQAWARSGHLTVTPGDAIDYQAIKRQVIEDATKFALKSMNVDRLFQGYQLAMELTDEGLPLFGMGQGFLSMAIPMKEFEKRLLDRKLHHGAHPVLRWMAGNVAVKQDPAGNLKPDKATSQGKIDGVVALIMAIDRVMRKEPPRRSVYEDRGLEAV